VGPVWDLKIVAGRILGQKSIEPASHVWGFERLADLDACAIADNLAAAASRCLLADPGRLDAVEAWTESPHLCTRRAALVFTLPWAKERDPERMLGWAARLASDREWFIRRRSAGSCANCRNTTPGACAVPWRSTAGC
jgi:hypothetical protein